MKVAVASQGEMVSAHFGGCENFNIFEIQGGQVVGSENVSSPGHDCGALPLFLRDQGASVVISGGMGQGAMNNLKRVGMEVILGASGTARDVIDQYATGSLVDSGSLCQGHGHHHHGGECGHH